MVTKKITIRDFVEQVNECIHLDYNVLKAAEESNLNTVNNKDLCSIVKMWSEGWYDENPQEILNQIKKLLKIR